MVDTLHRHRAALDALHACVLDSPGKLSPGVRRAAYEGSELPEPLSEFAAKVRHDSARVTDADVTSLRSAGLSEDEVLEVTMAAALGAATGILRSALNVLERRLPNET